MLFRLRPVLGGVAAVLIAACSSTDRPTSPAQGAPTASGASDVVATVAHRDPRLGVPTFTWFRRNETARFDDAPSAASAALRGLGKAMAIRPEALAALGDPQIHDNGQSLLVRYRQHVRDIEVFRGGLTMALRRDFEPVAASGLVVASIAGSERAFSVAAETAVAAAVAEATGRGATLSRVAPKNDYDRFAAPGLHEPARTKRVFFPKSDGDDTRLEPGHYVEVIVRRGPARSYVFSAIDGRLLFQNDLIRHESSYTYRVYADPTTLMPMDGPQGNALMPHPTGVPDHIKPTWVPSQLVTLQNAPFSKNDPWLPAGATKTEGNNVYAYADVAEPAGFADGDVAGATSAAGKFDWTYDTNASPGSTQASQKASITQLFYTLNFLHDWFYDAGFDEKSANHQTDNLGRGGKGGDELLAVAQDFAGRNNAYALVPADGTSPQVHMFVFAGSSDAEMVFNSPASIAGTRNVGVTGGWGKDLFDFTGTVVLASDEGGADPADGCEPLLAPATGKIVLMHRGTCSFIQKAQTAQAAGAAGAIIANVASSTQPTVAPFMGGTIQGVTIPVLSLSEADGKALEAAIKDAPSVTMKRVGGVDLDGALDTSIVAHEWGHVLSGRLVGNGNGLNTNQSGGLGEGWGDFTALLLSARPDDPGQFGGVYANGSYAMSGGGDDIYFGTRRVPYSIDFTKNPLTLKHIQNGVPLPSTATISFGEEGSSNAEVHNTGEVWASMLWECYVGLLRDGRHSFTEAQDRMKRYLVASLKLTPPDPTILEARDAVLAAAIAADPADATVFWQAFARRGAGAGAEGPGKESSNNVGVKESFTAGNAAIVTQAILRDDVITCDHDNILDEGEVATIELQIKNAGAGTLSDTKAQITSKTPGVSLIDATLVPLGKLDPFQSTSLKVTTSLRAGAPVDLVDLEVTLSDPSFEGGAPVTVNVPARYQADEAPESSAIDTVETSATSWTAKTTGARDIEWTREAEGKNHFWSIPNGFQSADNRLSSPGFRVEGTTFSVSFKHRWFFRTSRRSQRDQDGGVVELSIDGGPWKDISTYGAIDYNTTLDENSRGDNPLKGRKAYGNKSKGYPTEWIQSKVDVTLPAPSENVAIRFRVGNGDAFTVNAEGWDVDDIEITGAAAKPFFSFVPHGDNCDPNGPSVNAGPGKSAKPREVVRLEGSGTHPTGAPLTFMWRQIAGPPVALRDPTTPTPSFDAPADPATIGFELRAHDGKLLSAASRVDVTVASPPGAPKTDDGGCSCDAAGRPVTTPTWLMGLVGLALFGARRTRRSAARDADRKKS